MKVFYGSTQRVMVKWSGVLDERTASIFIMAELFWVNAKLVWKNLSIRQDDLRYCGQSRLWTVETGDSHLPFQNPTWTTQSPFGQKKLPVNHYMVHTPKIRPSVDYQPPWKLENKCQIHVKKFPEIYYTRITLSWPPEPANIPYPQPGKNFNLFI